MDKKIAVSACLLGFKCRWDGESRPCEKLIKLQKEGKVLPVCPEELGGLSVPRIPSEVKCGDGEGVVNKANFVFNKNGEDVTENFLSGAEKALQLAKDFGASEFLGKFKSPSCGLGKTYDGTFTGKLTKGDGVAVALFKKHGFKILTENDIEKL
jgi:uncharacterized protein YbbK (DUF523 family)